MTSYDSEIKITSSSSKGGKKNPQKNRVEAVRAGELESGRDPSGAGK